MKHKNLLGFTSILFKNVNRAQRKQFSFCILQAEYKFLSKNSKESHFLNDTDILQSKMDKLARIREEKQRLKKRVLQLEGEKGESSQLTEEAMAALLKRKQKLQYEKLQQEKYRKMQEQYLQRKAQVQRQRQLQKIKNQRRMIELQVGMKRMVLNGVQQKVKGMNSDQLMARVMLSGGNNEQSEAMKTKWQMQKSRQQIRGQFEKYLQHEQKRKERPKYDLYKLNEKRVELFEKKQELLMREILLKQVIMGRNSSTTTNQLGNNKSSQSLDQDSDHTANVMTLTKQQMQIMLIDNNIDIEQYMQHSFNQRLLPADFPQLQQSIHQRIAQKKLQLEENQNKQHNLRQLKAQLKDWVRNCENKHALQQVRSIIYDLIQQIVFDYEKRHFPLTGEDRAIKMAQIQKEYNSILLNNQFYDLSSTITDRLLQNLKVEMLQDVATEIHQLHSFAHDTTELSFGWLFESKSFLDYIKMDKDKLDQIKLQYDQPSDDLSFGKRDRKEKINLNNEKKQSHNVFQTQSATNQLLHDIKLLTNQQQYFELIDIQIKREIIESIDEDNFMLKNQGSLYIITSENIKLVSQEKDSAKTVISFKNAIKNIKDVKKINNTWLILTKDNLFIYTQWSLEVLPLEIGERINSPSGKLATVQIFPVFTMLGSLCSVVVGFQKGQVMKYNFNRNRITSLQNNLTYYHALGPIVKTGDQPSFPLHLKNTISYITQKQTNDRNNKPKQLHEFREFFDHHTQQIINIFFYKQNTFITVDRNMRCSLWLYDSKRGTRSYQPYYQFIISSQYTVYKESDNPRFQQLYPSPDLKQTPTELYSKWMQQQTYLRKQIYNNPKKNTAYFKPPTWVDNSLTQQPVWKFTYDLKTKEINRIFSTYYNLSQGKAECKQAKLWKDNLVLLVQRQHVMRDDLKTLKIYLWNIQDKKLLSIAVQFDTFHDQQVFNFEILPNQFENGVDYPLVATISSGKILIFSMLSGQLLKDVSQLASCSKVSSYNFTSIHKGYFSNFYSTTKTSVTQFVINNKNSKQKTLQFMKVVDITRKKYNNLA